MPRVSRAALGARAALAEQAEEAEGEVIELRQRRNAEGALLWQAECLGYHGLGASPQAALARLARFLALEEKMRPLVYREFLRRLEAGK